MIPDQSRQPDQDAVVPNDPMLNKEAVNQVVDEYEKSANSDDTTELDIATQKELGEVERALEDTLVGMDDGA